MSDYDDDFENDNDDFNDRAATKTMKTKPVKQKPAAVGKKTKAPEVGYDASPAKNTTLNSGMDTLARDKTLGIKPKVHKKPFEMPTPSETPAIKKSKPNILSGNGRAKGLTKQGGVYSSTPNLKSSRGAQKRSLLGGEKLTASKQVIKQFGLTKKAEQTIIPSKGMILEKAEKLIDDAKNKIDTFKSSRDRVESGNIDERLEVSIKENRYLQKTLIDMQDVINKVFEKYDPVKAPMKSYPQTERIKSPPKSVQMKYRTKEVENAQHALDNMMVEYEKVQARMEMIKDPNFFSNLHFQLDQINREMKDLNNENKSLQTEQKKREVEMEKLIAQGAPDTMFQINDLQNKVTITKDQLRKENAENEEVDSLMEQVIEQEKALREKEAKLKEIGAKYDINFDQQVDEKKQIEAEKLQAKRETYDKHLAIAESATKTMKKKLKTTSKLNKMKLKELETQKAEYEHELEVKSEQVKIKNKEIAELMERNQKLLKRQAKDTNDFLAEKPSGGYDAVLKAIEQQNEKEVEAAIIIQAWCRMILATRFVTKLHKQARAKKSSKNLSKNKPKMADSGTDYEPASKSKVAQKPSSDQKPIQKVKDSGVNYESQEKPTPHKRESVKNYEPEASAKKRTSQVALPESSDQIGTMQEIEKHEPSIKSKPTLGNKRSSKPDIATINKTQESSSKKVEPVDIPYIPSKPKADVLKKANYEHDKPVDDSKYVVDQDQSNEFNTSKEDQQKASLKKVTSKPSFIKSKKLTSKPF